MSYPSLTIIDNFYDNPQLVRNVALKLNYSVKKNALYPGKEAYIKSNIWEESWNKMTNYIPEKVIYDGKNPPFLQGKFRIATLQDAKKRIDRVHVDQQKWSGIICLTEDENCKSGLVFYKHKPTNNITWDEKWFKKNRSYLTKLRGEEYRSALLELFLDENEFEEIGTMPIRFNRAIVFMAKVFHGTGKVFGDSVLTGRLTQHFEFYDTQ